MRKKDLKKLISIPLVVLVLMFSGCPAEEVEKERKEEKEKTEKVEKHKDLKKSKVAVLVTEGFHDGEAYMPIGYLANKGIFSLVIGPEKGIHKSYNSDFTIKVCKEVGEVSVDYFDALILPGGRAPSKLREDEGVINFVKDFYKTGKPIAAICHGPQILITAGVLEGKTATGFKGIKDELIEAGVNYKDEAVVIYENIITSRTPPDLYKFSRAIKKSISEKKDFECKK